ncbi:hypothetical protein BDZ94DRAFT_1257964 [Collybia nuda]|uniref:Uncharacterized protein n=1 Tax=Collybia nuda TaxID=64659 RepID=A0A9P6CFB0_9AGAR|nr:hypothetical protein BDZ94DRAFT_1257964 [Collybia nuda]
MTSALIRYTENMILRKQNLEDVWFNHFACLQKSLKEGASELSVCLMDYQNGWLLVFTIGLVLL